MTLMYKGKNIACVYIKYIDMKKYVFYIYIFIYMRKVKHLGTNNIHCRYRMGKRIVGKDYLKRMGTVPG